MAKKTTDTTDTTANAAPKSKSIVLADGRTAVFDTVRGYHALNAFREFGDRQPLAIELTMAFIAQVCRVDGQAVYYKDVLDWEAADIMRAGEFVSAAFTSALGK